jgi:hypothetical protein
VGMDHLLSKEIYKIKKSVIRLAIVMFSFERPKTLTI